MFIKDKTKVACRMSGIQRRVVYFRKLLFETNNEKFSLRRVKSKKVSKHPGGNELQSSLKVGDTRVKVTRMEGEKQFNNKWEEDVASNYMQLPGYEISLVVIDQMQEFDHVAGDVDCFCQVTVNVYQMISIA